MRRTSLVLALFLLAAAGCAYDDGSENLDGPIPPGGLGSADRGVEQINTTDPLR